MLIGGAVGGYLGYKYTQDLYQNLNNLVVVSTQGQYAYIQYLNADYPEAKEALLSYITLLEELKERKDKYFRQNIYFFDAGLAYARLALLEERFANFKEKEDYMTEAKNRFKAAGWKDYSENKIREALGMIDRAMNIYKKKE